MNDRDIEILFQKLMAMDTHECASALVQLFGYMDAMNSHAACSGDEKKRDEAQAFFIGLKRFVSA